MFFLAFVILWIPLIPVDEPPHGALYSSLTNSESVLIGVTEVPSDIIETSDGGLAFILDSSYRNKKAVVKTDGSGKVQWGRIFSLGSVLLETRDQGFIVGGCEFPGNLTLIKIDAMGITQWDRIYPFTCDLVEVIEVSDMGLVLITGSGINQFIIKSDENGNIQWMKNYTNEWGGDPEISAVIQTNDGGYALAGSKLDDSSRNFWSDICLLKLDTKGVSQWNQSFQINNGRWERTNWWGPPQCTLTQASDGGFTISAHICGYTGPLSWLIETSQNGITHFQQMIQWKDILINYANSYFARNTISFLSSENGFILVGTIHAETNDIILAKTDPEGILEWEKVITERGDHDEVSCVVATSDKGFLLAWRKWPIPYGLDAYYEYTALVTRFNAMGDPQWTYTYNIELNDEEWTNTLVETSDGGFALAGLTSSYSSGLTDLWLIRTDDCGTIMWNTSYGGVGDEIAESIIQTSDGGFVLIGSSTSYGQGQFDIWLVKTDSMGKMEWNRTYGATTKEQGYFLEQTVDGGFALVGLQFPNNETGPYKAMLVKTDPMGVIEWNQTYSIPKWRFPHQTSFIQTNDEGYLLFSTNQLLKLNKSGNIQWNKSLDSIFYYGGSYPLDYYSIEYITQTDDDGFLIGTIETPYLGSVSLERCVLVKLDEEGIIQWMRVWGGIENYYNFEALHITDDGILIWLTFDLCNPSPDWGYLIAQIGFDGVSNWNKTYSNVRWRYHKKNYCYCLDSILSTDEAFIVTGYIQYSGLSTINTGNSRDAWLAKVDTNGNFLWNKTFGTTGGFNIAFNSISLEDNVSSQTDEFTSVVISSNESVKGFKIIPLLLGVIMLKKRKKWRS